MKKNIKIFLFFFLIFYSFIYSQNKIYYYSCTVQKAPRQASGLALIINNVKASLEDFKIKMRLEINNNLISGDFAEISSGQRYELSGKLDTSGFILNKIFGKSSALWLKGSFKKNFKIITGTISDTNIFKNAFLKGELEATGRVIIWDTLNVIVKYPVLNRVNPFYKKEKQQLLDYSAMEEFNTLMEEAKLLFNSTTSDEMKNDIKQRYRWETIIYPENISKNVLSILKLNSQYFGSAQPNHRFLSLCFDTRPHKYEKFIFADLFKDTTYKKIFSDIILQELTKQRAPFVLNKEINDLTDDIKYEYLTYLILPKGIRFDFSPAILGRPVDGSFFVFIPYEKIKHIINPKGALSEYRIK